MVLICVPIVQESHTTPSIYPHSSYVFDPMPMLKGVWMQMMQKGVCWGGFMPWEPLSGGCLMHWLLSEGSRLPSLMPSPPFHLTVYFPQSAYEQTIADEMFWAATMIAAFLLHLGILYSPCLVLHKLFGNSFDSARIMTLFIFIAPSILFLQMHQMHSWCFWGELIALGFLQEEETGSPWFLEDCQLSESLGPWAAHWNLLSPLPGWPLGSQSKSIPVGPPFSHLGNLP